MKHLKLILIAVAAFAAGAGLVILAGPGGQHHAASGSQHHAAMTGSDITGAVRTGGQAAFAEIAQITAELRADPETDWSAVNIDGLREHLADMDNVTLHSRVSARPTVGGAVFTVTADSPQVVQSIRTMTTAHGMMTDAEGLSWTTEELPDGALVTVQAADESGAAMIRGLGLFGLLTLGDHHAVHHRMMARGQAHH